MKKHLIGITTAMVLVFGTASLIGCGGEHQHEEHPEESLEHHTEETSKAEEQVFYACPMDCENGKVYKHKWSCPECKMELVKVEKEQTNPETHDHEHTFSCPMHPEEKGHEGDKCGKCGMDLEEVG